MRLSSRTAPATLVLVALGLILLGTGCGKSVAVGADGAGGSSHSSPSVPTIANASGAASAEPASPQPRTALRARTSRVALPPATSTSPSPTTPALVAPGSGSTPGTLPSSRVLPPAPPPIVQSPIPFGAKRKAEMVRYALRHYGIDTYRLIEPHVIVIHYTETPDFQSTYNTFAPDTPDSELHELPNTCAHFVVSADGTIHQLVPLGIMCRHTVGLNWTAIGVEHVGYSDAEVLDRPRQMRASLRLVRWLRCRFHIPVADVIGHNESLSSPYHHENVSLLRTQTHSDFNRADMRVYRARLGASGQC
jgi:N-acetylmuramoyl-L-alanine amidase